MLKFILPMIILLGCSHTSKVHHNDPGLTLEMNQNRQLLMGFWESANANKSEKWLLELRPTGEYVLNKKNNQDHGIWGISGTIYFNLNQKSASAFRNYKILKLTPDIFEYMDPTTGETSLYRRTKRPFVLK